MISITIESSGLSFFDGKAKLRQKGGGKGTMISSYTDGIRGFGFPVNQHEENFRKEKKIEIVSHAQENKKCYLLGVEFFEYGEKNDGYWDNVKLMKQVNQTLNIFEALAPNKQLVLEVDHSSNHLKKADDALAVSNMQVKPGGKQDKLRDTTLTIGCLGSTQSYTTKTKDGEVLVYNRKNAGDIQKMVFTADDLPPYLFPDTPKHDTIITDKIAKAKNAEKL